MNPLMLVYAAFVALSNMQSNNLSLNQTEWMQYKNQFAKQYQDVQTDSLRHAIFAWNKHKIDTFNAEQSESLGYIAGVNHLTDWSDAECQRLNGLKQVKDLPVNTAEAQKFLDAILEDDSIPVPEELDWRKTPGRVSEIKNQADCGSCWAFSATGSLEGQELTRNVSRKELITLSEQNLVDCVTKDWGCNGGYFWDALDYVKNAGGINTEHEYPYKMKEGFCRFDKSTALMADKGFAMLPSGDEEALKKVVARFGPVSVGIDAVDSFLSYKSGVYVDDICEKSSNHLDHAVLVIGYGHDEKGGDYWLVKNSWSNDWGNKGFIMMARNRQNQCGIATAAAIPIF